MGRPAAVAAVVDTPAAESQAASLAGSGGAKPATAATAEVPEALRGPQC